MGADSGNSLNQLLDQFFGDIEARLPQSARTLCKPGRRVFDVSVTGGQVELRFRGPRRGVRLWLSYSPEVARVMAAQMIAAAEEIDGLDEAERDWEACAAYDVPGVAMDGVLPS